MVRNILLLGNPVLYQTSQPVEQKEIPGLLSDIQDMWDTIADYRKKYGAGRAIAAPQIGLLKRIICTKIPGRDPQALINPQLEWIDQEQMEVMDDCMSFPGLLVRLNRFKRCKITFRDLDWNLHTMELEGDLSELIQHEYDHLDGILATMHAKTPQDLFYRLPNQKEICE
ncbi:MAG: peptide deformylase [Massiliimalia sp.]|jgi:peptide deformylase